MTLTLYRRWSFEFATRLFVTEFVLYSWNIFHVYSNTMYYVLQVPLTPSWCDKNDAGHNRLLFKRIHAIDDECADSKHRPEPSCVLPLFVGNVSERNQINSILTAFLKPYFSRCLCDPYLTKIKSWTGLHTCVEPVWREAVAFDATCISRSNALFWSRCGRTRKEKRTNTASFLIKRVRPYAFHFRQETTNYHSLALCRS